MSSSQTKGSKILRIGLFQNGEFLEERLIHSRGSVTIGTDYRKNTFVFPASTLPATFTVFEPKGDGYTLHFAKDTSVKLSMGDGRSKNTATLIAEGVAKTGPSGHQVAITPTSYGRIAWGTGEDEVALLFQFVAPPPPRPKLVLPASMRGGLIQGIVGSLLLVVVCSISAIVQIGFVAFLLSRDWPEPRELQYTIPDRFVRVMLDEPEQEIELSDEKLEPTDAEEEGPGEGEAAEEEPAGEKEPAQADEPKETPTTPEQRAAADAERKRRLSEEVANTTILGQLGALSSDGSLVDTLAQGAGRTSMADAFANSKGVTTGQLGAEKSGLRTTGSSGADGKGSAVGIDDLKGTSGATAAKAGVDSGSMTEKKVRVQLKFEKEKVVGTGVLDSNSITSVIKRRQSSIQRCYERELKKDPSVAGKVVVTFTIGTAGRVTSATASSDTVGGGVGQCVAGEIQRMRFPPPQGGEVNVNMPFVFSGSTQ